MALGETFGRLLDILRARGNPVVDNLLPGISPEEQHDLAAAEGLELDAEVVAWYSLIGGLNAHAQQYSADGNLAVVFQPATLPQSLAYRRSLVDATSNPAHYDSYLPGIEAFLPITISSNILHCAVNRGGPRTPIHRFDIVDSNGWYDVETYPSIEAMVDYWIRRWENGSYRTHPRMGVEELWRD